MKYYVIQLRPKHWEKNWVCISEEYATLDEARAALAAMPIKADLRIAEACTYIRFRAISEEET